jgi:peroxiredoxin
MLRKLSILSFLWILLFFSGNIKAQNDLQNFIPKHISEIKTGQSHFDFEELKKNKASVIIFLASDCPLSQKYTLTIKKMQKEFLSSGVEFYAISPGELYTDAEIEEFCKRYKLDLMFLRDKKFELVKKIGATITPEVFVFDETLTTIYSGAIDNWYLSLNKKRSVITENYLYDALSARIAGKEILIKKTEAVGCIIEIR